jgi:2-polyprenyl-3-methyl-5-hydroxy-6-metoxy-1,4-benzoquinol methylase
MTSRRFGRLPSIVRRKRAPEFRLGWDDWHRRRQMAEQFVPWVESVRRLDGCTVLEYGCGNGPVTAAFAPRARRYLGIDIDAGAVAEARRILADGGVEPTLLAAPPERILDDTAQYRGEVDVFLCYAVLEHMSVDERLALLRLAREVVRPGGIIVVIETPNRLTPWDYHTSQLPFLNQLPAELALRYAERSQRSEFVDALRAAASDGDAALVEAFTRWGRGMSFHEFELVFEDLPRHAAACSWDPVLLPVRPIYRAELALQRVLDEACPGLPPSFSRYWLDLIVTAEPQPEARRFLRPWPLRTAGSVGATYESTETVGLPESDSMLAVDLPIASERMLVVVQSPTRDLVVDVRQLASGRELRSEAVQTPESGAYADLRFSAPGDRYEIRLSAPGSVTLVAYEA